MEEKQTFHLGLCMAGSVSAGAYTAGVIDYLMEALERWQAQKGDPSIPTHEVEIDLLGGSSGGGITAAMAMFGFRDKVSHVHLEEDRQTHRVEAEKNIFWNAWVELTGNDVFAELLDDSDVNDYYIPSALNASFIDRVAKKFEQYVLALKAKTTESAAISVPFLSKEVELFLTLFNVTGMKYELSSRANSATTQYVSEHRDLAHFRWADTYEGDGRMEIAFENLQNLPSLIQAAKATGAFPVGLKARLLERKAKYIWDNPFFQKNKKFNEASINLGNDVTEGEQVYQSLNADGGTSNNEPVEMMRDLMLQIRLKERSNQQALATVNAMDDTEKKVAQSKLTNYSIILVDPFPSYNFDIEKPGAKDDHLLRYSFDLLFAMNSQLQFDAKQAIEAYDKNNYGLHIIAPSRADAKRPEYAIACGALGGFGGFLHKEYRVHDFFLGRHNCQSFLRKYFVVDPDEKENIDGMPNDNYDCIKAVLKGYQNETAKERFCFRDEKGKRWLPIIPDVTLTAPIKVSENGISTLGKQVNYDEPGKLPLYKMQLPAHDFLDAYREKIKDRANKLLKNVYDSNWLGDIIIHIAAMSLDDTIADAVIKTIQKDLNKRGLLRAAMQKAPRV